MSRLSRPYVQNFQTQTLGATVQFGSKSGCGATLGATDVQTFQTFLSRLSRVKLSARLCNLGLNRDATRPLARLKSRRFRVELLARICNLLLNPDAARPLARFSRPYDKIFQTQALGANLHFLCLNLEAARPLARLMSRLSRPYVQTFQTRTLGAILQFGSKSGCGAHLGAIFVQTFQTL